MADIFQTKPLSPAGQRYELANSTFKADVNSPSFTRDIEALSAQRASLSPDDQQQLRMRAANQLAISLQKTIGDPKAEPQAKASAQTMLEGLKNGQMPLKGGTQSIETGVIMPMKLTCAAGYGEAAQAAIKKIGR